jgi:hypothetical protein
MTDGEGDKTGGGYRNWSEEMDCDSQGKLLQNLSKASETLQPSSA